MDRFGPADLDLFLGGEDEEQQDLRQPAPHVIVHVMRQPDGTARVHEQRTEAAAAGLPSVTGGRTWFPTVDAALAQAGRSRIERDGAVIHVYVDGVLVE
ncbi:MAG: hypothetical protein M3N29_05875 [Chloroflexota bacterium]|nr:hypothetical protein [Chloroflexota bacterium]